MPRRLPAVGIAMLLVLAAGCGADRNLPPSLERTADPGELVKRELNEGDVRMLVPSGWVLNSRVAPGVLTVATGRASLTVWAYPAAGRVPDAAAARAAANRLTASLAERSPQTQVEGTQVVEVAGAPAVELSARGEIGDTAVQIRSVHVYVDFTEYVIDAIAAPEVFDRVDLQVFDPVIDSLELGGTSGALAPGAAQPGAPDVPSLDEPPEDESPTDDDVVDGAAG